ncbi:MAG TPA: glutamate synthase [Methylomirabilota bacterium]|nr:glutamate synthase [Methylomirabilota bacterium]HEV8673503.1 glutamate synthase [Methylomirabilota bacterium]
MKTVECQGRTVRQINEAIRRLVEDGEPEILVRHPGARHNLAVAVVRDVAITIDGPAGYYAGGMSDGIRLRVRGSAGWGVAECLMSGEVVVEGNAGNGAAASIRGGTVVIRGDAAARAGIAMKGGLLVIGGRAGYMTGFMMQRGTIIICGDAGEALADSMYEGVVFVGGRIAELGNDAVVSDASPGELREIQATLARYGLPGPKAFRKVVSGRKLWNYDKKELDVWKAAF